MNRFVLISFIFLSACSTIGKKEADHAVKTSNTTDASEIFFQNLRQPYYHTIEFPQKHLKIFTLKSYLSEHENPVIPSIYFNWLDDHAYIRFKNVTQDNGIEDLEILWENLSTREHGSLTIRVKKQDHTAIALELYEHIKNDHRILLFQSGDSLEIFNGRNQLRPYHITLLDFIRLTGTK